MILNSPTPLTLRSPQNFTGKFLSPPLSPSSARFRPSVFASSTCLSPPKLASTSLYEVLGIPVGATNQDIKAAYRRKARSCHPDVAASIGMKNSYDSSSSSDEFIKIHNAYSTLSDPEKRADYDRRIFRRPSVSYSGVSASSSETVYSRYSGYTRRNWETDQCW